jgi:hypothetical protein
MVAVFASSVCGYMGATQRRPLKCANDVAVFLFAITHGVHRPSAGRL